MPAPTMHTLARRSSLRGDGVDVSAVAIQTEVVFPVSCPIETPSLLSARQAIRNWVERQALCEACYLFAFDSSAQKIHSAQFCRFLRGGSVPPSSSNTRAPRCTLAYR